MRSVRSEEASLRRRITDITLARLAAYGHVHAVQHAAVYVLFVCFYLVIITPVRYPTTFYDELVYLGFARWFSGTGVMPIIWNGALGHFGYSLFIAPAFALVNGFASQYKAVLVVNCLLLPTTYLSLYGIVRSLWSSTSRPVAITVSVVTCLYPSFSLYPTFAGSENAFVPVFAALILVTIKYLHHPSVPWAILLGILTAVAFAVHNRGLSVAILICAAIAAGALRRRLPAVPSAVVLILTGLGCWAVVAFKHYLEQATGVPFPDPMAQPFTTANVMPFLRCLGGQIFGLCIATDGLYVFGLAAWVAALRSDRDSTRTISAILLLSHVLVIFGSAFFLSSQDMSRLDHLLIGRYSEGTLAPVLVAGLALLHRLAVRVDIRRAWMTLSTMLVFVALFALLNAPQMPRLESIPPAHHLRINMIAVMPYVRLLETGDIESLALSGMLIAAVVVFLAMVRWNAAITFVLLAFVGGAGVVYQADVVEAQHLFHLDPRTGSPGVLSPALARVAKGSTTELGYDTSVWHPFSFSTYQLFHANIRFRLFNSRTEKAPSTRIIIAAPSWRPSPGYRAEGRDPVGGGVLWVRRR